MRFLSSIFSDLPMFLLSLPVILFSLTVHEFSHGFIAYKLGDPTARNFGRLTLNPLKHLDPLGTIMMVLFHFGWAKPVPIQTRYFKKPRRDMALTAAAGPISNLILGFIGLLLYAVYITVVNHVWAGAQIDINGIVFQVVSNGANLLWLLFQMNISLAVFNLIPIPPLDGSRLLFIFLPPKWYFGVMRYERYIQIAILVALWTGMLSGVLGIAVSFVMKLMVRLVSLLPFLTI
ncbi:MAG: site-2 protease family protein [Clostridia bacterium]|nr:site-2 protease family protein [Clostridia bacterium]